MYLLDELEPIGEDLVGNGEDVGCFLRRLGRRKHCEEKELELQSTTTGRGQSGKEAGGEGGGGQWHAERVRTRSEANLNLNLSLIVRMMHEALPATTASRRDVSHPRTCPVSPSPPSSPSLLTHSALAPTFSCTGRANCAEADCSEPSRKQNPAATPGARATPRFLAIIAYYRFGPGARPSVIAPDVWNAPSHRPPKQCFSRDDIHWRVPRIPHPSLLPVGMPPIVTL